MANGTDEIGNVLGTIEDPTEVNLVQGHLDFVDEGILVFILVTVNY